MDMLDEEEQQSNNNWEDYESILISNSDSIDYDLANIIALIKKLINQHHSKKYIQNVTEEINNYIYYIKQDDIDYINNKTEDKLDIEASLDNDFVQDLDNLKGDLYDFETNSDKENIKNDKNMIEKDIKDLNEEPNFFND